MRVKIGSSIIATVTFAALGSAQAQTVDFATCDTNPPACSNILDNCCTANFPAVSTSNPIVIPMDRCHQQYKNNDAPGSGPPGSADSNDWCADPSPYNDNGMF